MEDFEFSMFFYIFANISVYSNKFCSNMTILNSEDSNIEFVSNLKNGDVFTLVYKHMRWSRNDYSVLTEKIIGIVKSVKLNGFGRRWHEIYCYMFYNSMTGHWSVNSSCGCNEGCTIRKPTLEEYMKFKNVMRVNHLSINRRHLKIKGEYELKT